MNNEIYLDNCATTKPCKECIDAINYSLNNNYYNPSSLYPPSIQVKRSMDECRATIASVLNANAKNVYFTSSGTEANNIAILSAVNSLNKTDRILYTAIEHSSVMSTCKHLKQVGKNVDEIPVSSNGEINFDLLINMLDSNVKLICIMQVNNEVGVINDISKIIEHRNKYSPYAAIHIDAVQAFLKIPFSFANLNIQSYALSGHKIHATKGIGALVLQNNYKLNPIYFGGGQERALRPGTENTLGIEGLNSAIKSFLNFDNPIQYMQSLKEYFFTNLKSKVSNCNFVGPDPFNKSISAPHIISICFPPLRSDVLLNALASEGIYCSSGSACSSKKQKSSIVLQAMGLSNAISESTVRFSFSPYNNYNELDKTINYIENIYYKFAKYVRR